MIERFEPHGPQPAQALHGAQPVISRETLDLEAAVKRPRSGRFAHRSGWLVSMVAVGVLVGLSVVGAMKFVTDPVVAGGETLGAVQAKVSPTPAAAATQLLAGLHFDLSYPGGFDQVAQIKSDPQVIEQYRLSSKTNHRRSVTVDLRPLASGGVTSDASFKVRRLNMNAQYKEESGMLAGEAVTYFMRVDGQEKALFWPHGKQLLTITLTSSDPHDDVTEMMRQLAQVRWRS